jgi:hypothetical protein
MADGNIRNCQPQVESYLCADPAIFTTAEYPIVFGDRYAKGDRWADLVAWDARDQRLYIVEVSTIRAPAKTLAKRLNADWVRRDKLVAALARNGVKLGKGGLSWWIFIRRDLIDDFRDRLAPELRGHLRLTALEATLFYPDYQAARRTGGEPPEAHPSSSPP